MKLIPAFFRLVRWPNLLFITLTQLLFYYCIFLPVVHETDFAKLIWLILASVFIAAAGYIINDYFDLNIDQINKPNKNVFIRIIHRRWAIIWHFLFSVSGLIATAFSAGLSRWYLVVANIFCILLLWFYSTSLKKQPLIGNIVISVLTAWTILIFFFDFTYTHDAFKSGNPSTIKLFRIAFLYAGFAFVISLIREAVKDMEDLEGDIRYGCKTLPIVAGIRATKIYLIVWLVVLISSLVVLQLYVLQFGWWIAVAYSFVFIILPLCYFFKKLLPSSNAKDFNYLSKLSKTLMLTGILSMIFFRVYL